MGSRYHTSHDSGLLLHSGLVAVDTARTTSYSSFTDNVHHVQFSRHAKLFVADRKLPAPVYLASALSTAISSSSLTPRTQIPGLPFINVGTVMFNLLTEHRLVKL